MRGRSFQWFVAWRYLLDRPRRLSGAILATMAVAAWQALAYGAALVWFPLTRSLYVPGQSIPVWLPLLFGLALAAVPVSIVTAAIQAGVPRPGGSFRWSRTWRPREMSLTLLGVAAYAGVVALATLGILSWLRSFDQFGDARPPTWLFEPKKFGFALGAIALVPVLLLSRRFLLRGGAATLYLTGFVVGVVSTVLLLPAAYGLKHQVMPAFEAGGPGAIFAVIAALGAVALVVGVSFAARRPHRHASAAWILLGLALVAGAASFAVWLSVRELIVDSVEVLGGLGAIKQPMSLVIAAGIGAALVALTFILLVVRYFFTFFTTVSIGGVAIGSMALVVVLSVMSGFETDLREKILGSNAHIQVARNDEAEFTGYREVMEVIADAPDVVAQTPYLVSEGVIAASSNYSNSILKGIDPRTVASVTELEDDLESADALERMWPLSEDGSTLGPPEPIDPQPQPRPGDDASGDDDTVDPAPDDLVLPTEELPDFSGGLTEAPPPPEVTDPAPDDLDLPEEEMVDYSGGLDVAPPAPEPDEEPQREPLAEGVGAIHQDDPDPESGEGSAHVVIDDYEAELERYIPPEVAALPGILVGREMTKTVNLYTGQEVRIISPLERDTPVGPVPRMMPVRVAGVFYTGMYEYDLKLAYVELATLQDFLELGDQVSGIEVSVEDPERTVATVAMLRAALGDDFKVQDWKELNKSLFSALKLEKIAMFLVLVIIILVASFSIVGNLIMVVVEKAKEIAILKTLGTSNRGVMRIFITQGFFIGLVGTSIGVALGLVTCWLLIRFGLPLDPDVYYIDRLPIHVEPGAVVAVGFAGLAISVIATIYPAFVAARLRPVKGLRYE